MKFGKYAIFDEVKHDFKEEPEWYWKIKPPTSGDELAMSKFMVNHRIETGPDGVRREYPPTHTEICHREIALTFAGTNIPLDEKPVEEGGDPILKPSDAIETIEAMLRKMPHPMVMEIWDAIAEAVPGWGPMRPKVKSSSPS
jgi:hypothetical protein